MNCSTLNEIYLPKTNEDRRRTEIQQVAWLDILLTGEKPNTEWQK